MLINQRIIERSARLIVGIVLLAGFLANVSVVSAQYPTHSQVSKDGTAVLLEDYANLPLSSPTHGGVNTNTIDFEDELGRVTSLRSEPANAPLAATRFFVDDQSGTLYILDKAAKKFTPYIKFAEIFPKFVSDTGHTVGIVTIAFDPGCAKNGKFY